MPFTCVADPAQRAILTALWDEVCLAAGIEPQSPEGEEAANFIMKFYARGDRTANELRTALDEAIRDKSLMASLSSPPATAATAAVR